ncbi:acyl-coenzyme a thioesterase mitochondrial isoform x3 [Limosa lapponica baueri]|uniref:Acyl-coenzyme a thioesterase mitochondrial isoform x3 n=1 Tax=Limosa lapponica baueri TaxID=1758121 RepID=A0A2I0ULH1_LIMLA|nr:acyl-coenzyme a thioesterase mitochondrial isoform x3 [Limosa lapponica baueri]
MAPGPVGAGPSVWGGLGMAAGLVRPCGGAGGAERGVGCWLGRERRDKDRLCTMRKLPSVLARTLTSGTSGSSMLPDMSEGHLPIHVNNGVLWDHVQAMQERKALHTLLAKRQEDLPPRRMKDSYLEVILPLGSQPEIREKYLNVHNSVRFGRILEDLDSLGVLICYTHTKQEMQPRSPLSIVTALVDKINLCKKIIYPDCDIKFTGNVSWVGRTSMEVKMHMLQLHDGDYSPVLDATFVMVARDPENKRTVSFRSRKLPPNSVWMEDAKLKGLQICHPQERNIFNRIFGGFLMRKAFELGWATACSYGGSRPFIVSVDDIMFQRPVEVGSLLLLSAQLHSSQTHESNKTIEILLAKIKLNMTYAIQQKQASV